ncbi:MAG: hemerythrin domain-containing protein, partial [Rhodospirillaceae bacterium]
MLIEWNGSLEIGNPSIDDDHRRLVAEANELYDIISAKGKSDVVLAKIRDFAASLYRHFAAEEHLMQ